MLTVKNLFINGLIVMLAATFFCISAYTEYNVAVMFPASCIALIVAGVLLASVYLFSRTYSAEYIITAGLIGLVGIALGSHGLAHSQDGLWPTKDFYEVGSMMLGFLGFALIYPMTVHAHRPH